MRGAIEETQHPLSAASLSGGAAGMRQLSIRSQRRRVTYQANNGLITVPAPPRFLISRVSRGHDHQLIWNRPKDGARGRQTNSFYFRTIPEWNRNGTDKPWKYIHNQEQEWAVIRGEHRLGLDIIMNKKKQANYKLSTGIWNLFWYFSFKLSIFAFY